MDYAKRFHKYKNKNAVEEVRNYLSQKKWGLVEWEIASLANLCPDSADEAKSLIPSLKKLTDDELDSILSEIQTLSNLG